MQIFEYDIASNSCHGDFNTDPCIRVVTLHTLLICGLLHQSQNQIGLTINTIYHMAMIMIISW